MSAWLGRVWAVAAMTLLEARRRKVFTILLLFTAAILSSVAFFPAVGPEGRFRLVEVWSLRAATLFTAIVALFVAGFSLPGDFEQKRIYLLVTKPVSKMTVFLGRYAGFVLLLALFVGLMGAITVTFLRAVQLFGGGAAAPAAYPRIATADFVHERGHPDPEKQPPRLVITAEENGALVWRFRGLRRADYPETARGRLHMVLGAPKDPFRASGMARIVVRGTGVHEQKIFLQTREEWEFTFPSALIGADGALEVSVTCMDPDGAIAAWEESVVLFEKSVSFELNFARGMVLVLLQSMLVLSVTLAASTFLSAPVAIFLGILIYFVGSVHSYVVEGARDIDRSLEEHKKEDDPKHRHPTPENIPVWILETSTWLSQRMLAVIPDFEHYDFASRWLLKDRAVAWEDLARAALKAAPLVFMPMLLGMLIMRFKDFS